MDSWLWILQAAGELLTSTNSPFQILYPVVWYEDINEKAIKTQAKFLKNSDFWNSSGIF